LRNPCHRRRSGPSHAPAFPFKSHDDPMIQ
jgi:hypothetical protein